MNKKVKNKSSIAVSTSTESFKELEERLDSLEKIVFRILDAIELNHTIMGTPELPPEKPQT